MSCHHAWWNHVILKSHDITINIPMILYHSWGILMPSWFFWTKSHLNPKKKIWRQITIQSYWNPVLNLHSTAFVLNRLPIKKKQWIIIMFPIIVNYPWRIHGAGIYMLTWLGYIDGIHGTPYIAAPWILALGPRTFSCWFSIFSCSKSMTCRFSASL